MPSSGEDPDPGERKEGWTSVQSASNDLCGNNTSDLINGVSVNTTRVLAPRCCAACLAISNPPQVLVDDSEDQESAQASE